MDFKDTVAIVTGSARGIGLAIARRLFDAGSIVVISDLNLADCQNVKEAIGGDDPSRLHTFACNVSDQSSVESLFDSIKRTLGKIDILVNNAGITRDNLFMRMKLEEWQSVISVNLTGSFLCARNALPLLRKSSRGRIINISSVAARGNAGQANYAASKSGVIGFTKTLALELARYGITVNAIAPGFIDTEMTRTIPEKSRDAWIEKIPCQKPGSVDDVANAIMFFAAEESAYITGQVLGVDGGLGI